MHLKINRKHFKEIPSVLLPHNTQNSVCLGFHLDQRLKIIKQKSFQQKSCDSQNETTSSVLAKDFASLSLSSHVAQCSVSFCDSYSDGGLSK